MSWLHADNEKYRHRTARAWVVIGSEDDRSELFARYTEVEHRQEALVLVTTDRPYDGFVHWFDSIDLLNKAEADWDKYLLQCRLGRFMDDMRQL